jgi:hypothetical protein
MTISEATRLLIELEPVVAENLDRHLSISKEWMPHEYIPWSEGRNYVGPDGEPWSAEQSRLSPIARTALELNLLTEDNLPSYHREIQRAFGNDGPWGTWVGRWTAEEGRHGYALRDYLLVTRGVDPEQLERARMAAMTSGFDSGDKPLLRVCAYVSVPGARDAGQPPQHRQVHRRPDRRQAHGADLDGREPAHDLLPQPGHRLAGDQPGRDGGGDPRRDRRLRDAGCGGRGVPAQGVPDGAGRDLRPRATTWTTSSCRCCGTGASWR